MNFNSLPSDPDALLGGVCPDPHSQESEAQPAKRSRRIRYWIFICILALVLSPTVSVLVGLNFHARDFSYTGAESEYPGRQILLEAILISADPKLGTLTLDWNVMGEANSSCSKENLTTCSDVGIFFDNNLLRMDKDSGSGPILNNRPTQPIFIFNATAKAVADIMVNTPTFRTPLALFSPLESPSSLIYYPFDRYTAEIFIFAQDMGTNETVGVSLGKTRGIAVGFKTSAAPRLNVDIPPGTIDIIVTLQRGNLVKTYSIVATIAIWLVTLILLLVMITSVFFGFRQKGEVLVVPVATLFAFVTLRQSMPGAPEGFGDIIGMHFVSFTVMYATHRTLDFTGILPCLALLALSAAFTLGAFVLTDPTDQTLPMTWDAIYDTFPHRKHHQVPTVSRSGSPQADT
ncbi:hypothetical protein D9758_010006 [Tetrapyrgos nigripes]|uniref:Transmembrane protein n=1 Tax=Tetrapyrgos nigripes TaxID=182062 RepID=A0A8H5FT01_9AGAR|nr:hypothetical protein D9758_010006 [Tetrapyrgos nigripes]